MPGRIDLNCDMGESFGRWRLGADEELMAFVTSANIACGFHAGDPDTMRRTVESAVRHGVAIGVHPGYPDLIGFGRRDIDVKPDEVRNLVLYQMGALAAIAQAQGGKLTHVKPHGALYNKAAKDARLAAAIVQAVQDFNPTLVLVGLANSELVRVAKNFGLPVANEVFADRTYQIDGSLTSRKHPHALIIDAPLAAARVVRMVKEGKVRAEDGRDVSVQADTVCIHGDNANSVDMARTIRSELEKAGITVRSLKDWRS